MIIFIGGSPRAGKTILAQELADKIGASWISTDSLRAAAKCLTGISKNHPIFIQDRLSSGLTPEEYILKLSSKEHIKIQCQESKEVVNAVKGYVESIKSYKRHHVFEGVALMPSLIGKDFIQEHKIIFVCIGITSWKSLAKYFWDNRLKKKWSRKFKKDTLEKLAKINTQFSKIFISEAKKFGIPFFEIRPDNFDVDLDKAINYLTSNLHN